MQYCARQQNMPLHMSCSTIGPTKLGLGAPPGSLSGEMSCRGVHILCFYSSPSLQFQPCLCVYCDLDQMRSSIVMIMHAFPHATHESVIKSKGFRALLVAGTKARAFGSCVHG